MAGGSERVIVIERRGVRKRPRFWVRPKQNPKTNVSAVLTARVTAAERKAGIQAAKRDGMKLGVAAANASRGRCGPVEL
jgi:hypothetical protein